MRWLIAALALSLVFNLLGAALLARRQWRRRTKPVDYAALASARFGALSGGEIVYLGDSHIGNAPMLELLTNYRQWGIGGQLVRDVTGWARRADAAGRVVLSAGTNDVLIGRSPEQIESDFRELLAEISCPVTVLSVPSLRGHEATVSDVNERLRRLAAALGASFVALPSAQSEDGVHLTRDGYATAAAAFRAAGHATG